MPVIAFFDIFLQCENVIENNLNNYKNYKNEKGSINKMNNNYQNEDNIENLDISSPNKNITERIITDVDEIKGIVYIKDILLSTKNKNVKMNIKPVIRYVLTAVRSW